jgi:hypothetical protein
LQNPQAQTEAGLIIIKNAKIKMQNYSKSLREKFLIKFFTP